MPWKTNRDDIRSVVQSIVLATIDPPNLEKTENLLSGRQVVAALELLLTMYQQIVKSVKEKGLALEYRDCNTVFLKL